MFRPRTAALLAAGLIGGAGLLASVPAASAASTCTAFAAMPAKVAVTSRHTVVHAVLRGNAACAAAAHDFGASAVLHGPAGWHTESEQWSHFGAAETVDLYVTIERSGTYTMNSGDVQVYDSSEVRAPSAWHTTTMTVRNGARFTSVHRGSSVTARLGQYTKYGWRASSGVTVALQQRSGSSWHTVAAVHSSRSGAVSVGHHLSRSSSYRLLSGSSKSVWGASASVR